MRLGAPIYNFNNNPEEWMKKINQKNYKAVYSPLGINSSLEEFSPYVETAKKNDIVISELGVWNNPLSSDKNEREKAIEACKKSLYYADELDIKCVVNISGSRGDIWDGPHEKNLTDETFDMIVEVVREIIDSVNPKRSFYTLETMPWMYPNSAETYLELIKAIDREAFSVHFDPVNLIVSPEKYYKNGDLIKNFVAKLGKHIKSVHLKDISLNPEFMVHLNEVAPGQGNLDYKVLFKELSGLDKNLPIMLEHQTNEKEYDDATKFVLNTLTF